MNQKYTEPQEDSKIKGCLYNMIQEEKKRSKYTHSFPLKTKYKHSVNEKKLKLKISSVKKIIQEDKHEVKEYKNQLKRIQRLFKSKPTDKNEEKDDKRLSKFRVMSSESIPEFSVTKSSFTNQMQNRNINKKLSEMKRQTNYSMKVHRKLSKSLIQKSMPLCVKITPSPSNFCITDIDQLLYTQRRPIYLKQNRSKLNPSIRKKKEKQKALFNKLQTDNERIKGWQVYEDDIIFD